MTNSPKTHHPTTIILVFILILTATEYFKAYSANGLVDVKNYSSNSGLSLKMVQNMIQDEDGYIWIATWNGLEKFNGYSFRNYKSYPTDDNRLQYNRIQNIYPAFRNGIWCETYDHRLYLFDAATEKFIDPFASHPDLPTCKEFVNIFRLDNGVVWLADDSECVWRINGEKYADKKGIECFNNIISNRQYKIYGVYSDGAGGEWILTDKGYWVYGKPGLSGVRRFVRALKVGEHFLLVDDKGSLVSYNPADGLKDLHLDFQITIGYADYPILNDHSCVFPTTTGLVIYDIMSGHTTDIPISGFDSASILTIYPTKSLIQQGQLWILSENEVYQINPADRSVKRIEHPRHAIGQSVGFVHEDARGEIWILPFDGPLCHYDHKTNSLERAYYYNGGKKTYTPDIMLTYMIDNHKNLLARDNIGFNKITFPTGESNFLSFSEYETRSLMIDKHERIWSCERNNELKIYSKDGEIIGYLHPSSGKIDNTPGEKFPSCIYTLLEDSKGRIWMGSRYDGIYIATPISENLYTMKHYSMTNNDKTGLNCNSIYSIFEDDKQRIWIGTYGGGINLVDETGKDLSFLNVNNEGLHYSFDGAKCRKVRHITSTSDGTMLIGTTDGLVTFSSDFDNPNGIKYYHNWCDISRKYSLSNNDVFYTFEDSRHDIYIATHGGGICRLKNGKLLSNQMDFSYIGKQNGLPTDIVYAIGEDKRGRLWLSLENSICSYVPTSGEIEIFDRYTFHLPIILSEAPFVINSDGKAYFPMLNGTFKTDLNTLQKSSYVPNIVFDRAVVSVGNDSSKVILLADKKLNLKANERNFAISFAALDYDNTENISYAYRIDGYEKWIKIGNNHEPTFYGMPAGRHVLEVRSTNGDGVWVDNVAQLPIYIEPTFMETIWAKMLTIASVVGICIAIWFIVTFIMRLRRQISIEQELTKLKLRFFTDVSHELRTPLTLIVNPIEEVMSDPTLSSKGQEYIAIARNNTNRMLKLINQLLDIRKIQNNKMKIYIEYVDIVPLFKQIYDDFSAIAIQKKIDFKFNMCMKTYKMHTDVDKLEKITFNLLSNAFKYTPNGGSVSLNICHEGENLVITVSDNGSGIDKKQVKNIFDRFETLGRKSFYSSGIGLSLVEELVKTLHGTIEVESTPGEGSQFVVKLKDDISILKKDPEVEFILTDESKTDIQEETISDTRITVSEEPGETDISIMIVEDNSELRNLLYNMLHERYRVTEATDGQDAWEKMNAEMPDMIISDIMMPRMDGLELLSKTRATPEYSHMPFILLSAKSSVSDRIEGIECGADDYITKPFSTSYLRSRIRSLIEQRNRLREYFIHTCPSDNQPSENVPNNEDLPALTQYDEKFVTEMREMIKSQLTNTALTIDEMAVSMNMGRTMFNRKVKSLFNMSPVELLKQMRINEAMHLLENDANTVAEVSYMCGFSSPQYFNRVFKSVTGETPKDWRQQKKSTT